MPRPAPATEKLAETARPRPGARRAPIMPGSTPQVRARNQADFVASRGHGDRAPRSRSAWGSTSPTCASSRMPACPSRSRPIIRRPAAPGATAIRRSRICSGARRISPGRASASARSSRARQPGERTRLNALGALVETAGCRRAHPARAISARTRPRPAAIATIASNPPGAVDATEVARKFLSAVFRTGQSFGVGYIESDPDRPVERAQPDERA